MLGRGGSRVVGEVGRVPRDAKRLSFTGSSASAKCGQNLIVSHQNNTLRTYPGAHVRAEIS